MADTPSGKQADVDALLKSCLCEDETGDALDCLKEALPSIPKGDPEICSPRLVLLTQPGCPFCSDERGHHTHALETGAMEELDINSERGKKIAKDADVDFTPAVFLVDCHDNLIEAACETETAAPAAQAAA